jgi:hypothetical protein
MTDDQMENALRLYRMYKEIRNGLVHSGAVASDRAEQACRDAAVVTSPADANLNYLWPLPTLNRGQTIPRVGLSDAIAFDAMVLQLVVSLEARLIASRAGSRELQSQSDLKTALARVFDVDGERAGARVSAFITKALNMKGVRSLPLAPTDAHLRRLLQGACSLLGLSRTSTAIERSAIAGAAWIDQHMT